jgi:hypothetical protein
LKEKSKFYKIGIGLIILSSIFWLIPLIVPFTSLQIKTKAGIITGSLVFAEVMFWIGALLAGKEVAIKFKSYLNPKNWRKQTDKGLKNNEK